MAAGKIKAGGLGAENPDAFHRLCASGTAESGGV